MSDNLPPPPPPPPGFEFQPPNPPPDDGGKDNDQDETELSFDDIRDSIDDLINETPSINNKIIPPLLIIYFSGLLNTSLS